MEGSTVPRSVSFTPRLLVNSVRAAAASAVEGHGVTRLFSYHIASEIKAGLLHPVLSDAEHDPFRFISSRPTDGYPCPRSVRSSTSPYRVFGPSSRLSRTQPTCGRSHRLHRNAEEYLPNRTDSPASAVLLD